MTAPGREQPDGPPDACLHDRSCCFADRRELELLQEIASNSDNIDYGEMIHAHDGSEEGITTFTDRGIESLKEFLADMRTWDGGVRQFLVDEQCDPERIERIMADEPKS
ncbi:hypothetical protein FHX14_002551 [Rhizobium sp. BK619]|nr:hypothetical protein [Rhizobium sp. BK619]